MIQTTIAELLTIFSGATLKCERTDVMQRKVRGYSSDTRALYASNLYFAFAGERHDGHRYLGFAAKNKASAAVVNFNHEAVLQGASKIPLICVPDTRLALQELARWQRQQYQGVLAAVVGSNGKTTCKEMIASIFKAHSGAGAHATQGNLNNDLGVPFTLLNLRPAQHTHSVVEMGMNHRGETAQLANLVKPTILLITNAQREHQEFMQSVAEVANEHADAITALNENDTLVLPSDDAYANVWRTAALAKGVKVIDFALQSQTALVTVNRSETSSAVLPQRFSLQTPQGTTEIALNIAGEHNVRNALAAAAVALAANIPLPTIAQGLNQFRPAKGRMQQSKTASGAYLINDTYNANPDSMIAALKVLAQSAAPRWAILGDMGEVGNQGEAFHQEIGQLAAELGIETVWTVGELSAHLCQAYLAAGGVQAQHFADTNTLIAALADFVTSNKPQSVLVKGSRFMRMESVVEALESMPAVAKNNSEGEA